MNGHFLAQNKFIWGFNCNSNGKFSKEDVDIKQFQSTAIKKFVDEAYETDLEIHVMPYEDMPFVMVKSVSTIWYFLTSPENALSFMKEIMIDGHYELCKVI